MNKNINIRSIATEDYETVYNVIRESFWNLYRPGCEEHLIAERIFKSKDYIPEISFVIELNNEIIGCILYTKIKIVNEDGKVFELISFGPVCILPKYHRQGNGRKLIEYSIAEAKRLGYSGIVIAGARKHYECYGFVGAKKFGLSLSDGKFYFSVMALPLTQNGLNGKSGRIYFADCMNDPTPLEVEEFDKRFKTKIKEILPCQEEFLKAVVKLDED